MATYLIKNGENVQRAIKEIIITDGSTPPDNGDNYNKETRFIPTGSTLQVLTDTTMEIFIFNSESGSICPTTNYRTGVWIPL